MDGFGRLWRLRSNLSVTGLATFGRLWTALAAVGRLLAVFGRFWPDFAVRLDGFGQLWPTSAAFGRVLDEADGFQ